MRLITFRVLKPIFNTPTGAELIVAPECTEENDSKLERRHAANSAAQIPKRATDARPIIVVDDASDESDEEVADKQGSDFEEEDGDTQDGLVLFDTARKQRKKTAKSTVCKKRLKQSAEKHLAGDEPLLMTYRGDEFPSTSPYWTWKALVREEQGLEILLIIDAKLNTCSGYEELVGRLSDFTCMAKTSEEFCANRREHLKKYVKIASRALERIKWPLRTTDDIGDISEIRRAGKLVADTGIVETLRKVLDKAIYPGTVSLFKFSQCCILPRLETAYALMAGLLGKNLAQVMLDNSREVAYTNSSLLACVYEAIQNVDAAWALAVFPLDGTLETVPFVKMILWYIQTFRVSRPNMLAMIDGGAEKMSLHMPWIRDDCRKKLEIIMDTLRRCGTDDTFWQILMIFRESFKMIQSPRDSVIELCKKSIQKAHGGLQRAGLDIRDFSAVVSRDIMLFCVDISKKTAESLSDDAVASTMTKIQKYYTPSDRIVDGDANNDTVLGIPCANKHLLIDFGSYPRFRFLSYLNQSRSKVCFLSANSFSSNALWLKTGIRGVVIRSTGLSAWDDYALSSALKGSQMVVCDSSEFLTNEQMNAMLQTCAHWCPLATLVFAGSRFPCKGPFFDLLKNCMLVPQMKRVSCVVLYYSHYFDEHMVRERFLKTARSIAQRADQSINSDHSEDNVYVFYLSRGNRQKPQQQVGDILDIVAHTYVQLTTMELLGTKPNGWAPIEKMNDSVDVLLDPKNYAVDFDIPYFLVQYTATAASRLRSDPAKDSQEFPDIFTCSLDDFSKHWKSLFLKPDILCVSAGFKQRNSLWHEKMQTNWSELLKQCMDAPNATVFAESCTTEFSSLQKIETGLYTIIGKRGNVSRTFCADGDLDRPFQSLLLESLNRSSDQGDATQVIRKQYEIAKKMSDESFYRLADDNDAWYNQYTKLQAIGPPVEAVQHEQQGQSIDYVKSFQWDQLQMSAVHVVPPAASSFYHLHPAFMYPLTEIARHGTPRVNFTFFVVSQCTHLGLHDVMTAVKITKKILVFVGNAEEIRSCFAKFGLEEAHMPSGDINY